MKNIKLMNILAAPEGIARVRADHPDVEIYIAAVDEKLNDHATSSPVWGTPVTGFSAPSKGANLGSLPPVERPQKNF